MFLVLPRCVQLIQETCSLAEPCDCGAIIDHARYGGLVCAWRRVRARTPFSDPGCGPGPEGSVDAAQRQLVSAGH